ncbi:MAG: hypothetical protein VB080_04500 [Propionicimonas sp.]|uniref:T3SS (YopN, CesT) and YbjN peptide-binding chaperone 1 n=1 Tax=Propionicimonas sp. TaxID=1955623 RepID=UPI002B218C59|nr:hypothetical protein [Propionicimonas sp.]MEA4943682.1 hypothetical protein [Propionicimonas sp.]MEA5054816.1 hypothetical protein [Propionicimonas sp.]
MSAPMNDFDLDRSIDEAWEDFSGRLAEVVSVMDPGGTLTLGSLGAPGRGPAPYVRFRCLPDRRILTTAAGNAELGETYQLGPHRLQQLADLGWEPPSVDGEHAGPDHWFVADQEDSESIAARAIEALRTVFAVQHPAFLAPDHLAEVLAPPTPTELPGAEYPADELIAVTPTSVDHLRTLVASELSRTLGYQPLCDTDGDYAIRVGSAMVFVRCTGDAREVIVFSPLVHEIEGRSRAMEILSDLNTQARYVRFLLIRDRVYASLSVLAYPFVAAHLHQALRTMTVVADEIDEELARRLRGRTSFSADS